MQKLSDRELAFVDHYLENSGIAYVDIRMEMTDHVASALENLEGDFYENLRLYMLEHKQELLKNNKRFTRLAVRRAFKALGKTLLKPWFLVLPVVLVYTCLFFAKTVDATELIYNLELAYMGLFLVCGLCSLFYVQVSKKKFSVASQVANLPGLIVYMLFTILKPAWVQGNALSSFIILSVLISLVIAIAVTAYSQNRKYRLQYR